MITTFFGAHSFGGDAAYVDRLSRALLRRGHEVHVAHCLDAFETVRGDETPRPYTPPVGLEVHALESRFARLASLWTHQTGGPGVNRGRLARILAEHDFDVLHFHNVSLIGGVGALELGPAHPIKLMTAHEHWLVCPLSLLWKHGDVCDAPECVPCTARAGRPPQLWRYSRKRDDALARLDALIFPSDHTRAVHRSRGVRHPRMVRLPYFLNSDWTGDPAVTRQTRAHAGEERPYLAAAGRLVEEKGFQDLIPAMRQFPGVDLRIAGSGPFAPRLRSLASGLPNVCFVGYLDAPQLAELYRGARAVVVPSLFYETFGYVAVEAFSRGTPAIVRDRGALPELIDASGAGEVFNDGQQLVAAIHRMVEDDGHRERLAARARHAVETVWSEQAHIDRYFDLISAARRRRRAVTPEPEACPTA